METILETKVFLQQALCSNEITSVDDVQLQQCGHIKKLCRHTHTHNAGQKINIFYDLYPESRPTYKTLLAGTIDIVLIIYRGSLRGGEGRRFTVWKQSRYVLCVSVSVLVLGMGGRRAINKVWRVFCRTYYSPPPPPPPPHAHVPEFWQKFLPCA